MGRDDEELGRLACAMAEGKMDGGFIAVLVVCLGIREIGGIWEVNDVGRILVCRCDAKPDKDDRD